jgi:DNA-binding XRE family transcriptional regulator
MDAAKRARLEAVGFRVGSVAEFLDLSPEENALVELRLALSADLRRRRLQSHLSQAALAKQLHSSQSRIAKMEAGDPSVSIDLLIRALLATGATRAELGEVIASPPDQCQAIGAQAAEAPIIASRTAPGC